MIKEQVNYSAHPRKHNRDQRLQLKQSEHAPLREDLLVTMELNNSIPSHHLLKTTPDYYYPMIPQSSKIAYIISLVWNHDRETNSLS